MMVFVGLWWDVHCTGYFYSEEYMNESFRKTVKRVVPEVEAYQSEHGHLPSVLSVEGLIYTEEDNVYTDTTRWDRMEVVYRHWGDSVYTIRLNSWAQYVSSPGFEGYLFSYWDFEEGNIKMDTVFRQY